MLAALARISPFTRSSQEPLVPLDSTDESFWSALSSVWFLTPEPIPDQSLMYKFPYGLLGFVEPDNKTVAAEWGLRLITFVFTVTIAACTYRYFVAYMQIYVAENLRRTGPHKRSSVSSKLSAPTKPSWQKPSWQCSRCRENLYQSYMHRFKSWLVHTSEPSNGVPTYLHDRFVPYRPRARNASRKNK